jgi:four helix bundle protein
MPDGFEALQVWQVAYALLLMVHRQIAPALPQHEQWDLSKQIRRSSKSIGANIAEGYGRYYFQDNVRFCYNARGSLLETIDHLVAARDLGYIEPKLYSEARSLADSNYRLLNGYIAYLKKRKFGADEPGSKISIADRDGDDPGYQATGDAQPSPTLTIDSQVVDDLTNQPIDLLTS